MKKIISLFTKWTARNNTSIDMCYNNLMRVILIIPAYNEAENILRVCDSIKKYNKNHSDHYDFIVINDCSTDSTSKICHQNHLPIVDLIQNLGIGGAVQTGYKYALQENYDIAVQFDGDGQHNINHVKDLIAPIAKNQADLVIGSRFIDKNLDTFKSSTLRRLGIKIIAKFMHFATGKTIFDTTSGFRACSKDIIKEFAADYPLEYPEPLTTAEIIKKDYRIKEIPTTMNARIAGQSSINSWKNIYYMVNVCLSLLVIKIRRYTKCH